MKNSVFPLRKINALKIHFACERNAIKVINSSNIFSEVNKMFSHKSFILIENMEFVVYGNTRKL